MTLRPRRAFFLVAFSGLVLLLIVWRVLLLRPLSERLTSRIQNDEFEASASDLVAHRFLGGRKIWTEMRLKQRMVKRARSWTLELPDYCTFDGNYRGKIEWKLQKHGEASYFHGGTRPTVTFVRSDFLSDPACAFTLSVPLL